MASVSPLPPLPCNRRKDLKDRPAGDGRSAWRWTCIVVLVVFFAGSVTAAEELPRKRIQLAVRSGLDYLAAQQREDGGFDAPRNEVAATGIAALATLANRDGTLEEKHETVLRRAVGYLLTRQNEIGQVGESPMFQHAAGMLAALHLLGMGEEELDGRLVEFCRRGVELTQKAQRIRKAPRNLGGWSYEPHSRESDIANTAWQVLVLESARQCGYSVHPRSFTEAYKFINRCAQKDGYGYIPAITEASGVRYRSAAGVALFVKELIRPGSTEDEDQVVEWLGEVDPSWGGKQYRGFFYRSAFYITLGMFQTGGERWDGYYRKLVEVLLKHQESDGRWSFPPGTYEEARAAGEVYATGMAVLMLSLEKQILPIYQRRRSILWTGE
jgi:hypothetical protein